MILLIDNYDSFTYNIFQYLKQLKSNVTVVKNDQVSIDIIKNMAPDGIVLGPGPGIPNQAGVSLDCINYFSDKLPILGVCLGHQAIAQAFGANIINATKIMHGRTSLVHHNNAGIFRGLSSPIEFTRYHSLIIDKETLPECFEISAWTPYTNFESPKAMNIHSINEKLEDKIDEIMAIRHKKLPIESVQFHPESILSPEGLKLFNNFLTQNQLI